MKPFFAAILISAPGCYAGTEVAAITPCTESVWVIAAVGVALLLRRRFS